VKNIKDLYWGFAFFAVTSALFSCAFFFSLGCGGLFGICSYVLDEPPMPVSDSFQRTPFGFGVYTDDSGTWQITDNVLAGIDMQYQNVLRCAEKKLDADIMITIEPAKKWSPDGTTSPSINITGMSSDASASEMTDEELAEKYPDEYPPDMFFDSLGIPFAQQNNSEENIPHSRILEGTISENFKIILSDKDACLLKKHTDGLTSSFDGHIAIWVNESGQLVGHEIEHVLARVLGLTEEEEESLYACTPAIEHVDFK